jgi:hypothetical protein
MSLKVIVMVPVILGLFVMPVLAQTETPAPANKDIAELAAKVNLLAREVADLKKQVADLKATLAKTPQTSEQPEPSAAKPSGSGTAPTPSNGKPSVSVPASSTGKISGNDSAATAKLFADFALRFSQAESQGTEVAKEADANKVVASMEGTQVTLTCSVKDVQFGREPRSPKGIISIYLSPPAEMPTSVRWQCADSIDVPGTEDQALKFKQGDTVIMRGVLVRAKDKSPPNYGISIAYPGPNFGLNDFSYSVISAK